MHGFPKLLHFMWYQGFKQIPAYLKSTPRNWAVMNSGYSVIQWDQENLTEFIYSKYPQFFETWSSLPSVIKKCDFARLLVLHYYGGVYLDCDLIPLSPLESLLSSDFRYCQRIKGVRMLPKPPPKSPVNFSEAELIFSREHRAIDAKGFGIANGVIIAKPNNQLLYDFLEHRSQDTESRVLDYLGPHALTRFIRSRAEGLQGKVIVLPPYYLLWEMTAMDEQPPDWTISIHLAKNHWGDHSKKDWWNV